MCVVFRYLFCSDLDVILFFYSVEITGVFPFYVCLALGVAFHLFSFSDVRVLDKVNCDVSKGTLSLWRD